jgi:nitroreductase
VDAYEAILTRRSIRQYADRAVDDETIRQLLTAAMHAPSAGNQQPWQFVVLTDRLALDALAEALPHGKKLRQAPLAIVVCGDLRMETNKGHWVQDCSAATENVLLAAHALGLGAVWLGVYPREERIEALSSLLALPRGLVPLAAISIGYPAEQPQRVDRYQEEGVHHNKW